MATNNNLSVLPFYGSIEEQNARKWWVYDKIYPLFTPVGSLLPFQITREHRAGLGPGNMLSIDTDGQGYLTINGVWRTDQKVIAYVARYDVEGIDRIYAVNLPFGVRTGTGIQTKHPSVVFKDGDDNVISYLFFDELYSGVIDVPGTAREMYIQSYNEQCYLQAGATIHEVVPAGFMPIGSMILYRADGTQYADISQHADVFLFKQIGDNDVIIYDGVSLSDWEKGQYYLKMSDGIDTWYSDVFTVVDDISDYLRLEWWNNADFVMDAGTIVYTEPDFRNVLYLCSDIAKPEYDFSDEVMERDGYTFPVLQISKKIYRFSLWASEYLLDVMRLIRMADNIVITKGGKTYDKIDSFLLTPDWEKEGDIASVDVEFTTDTVAKKTGNSYTIR